MIRPAATTDRRDLYRPRDPVAFAAAIVELHRSGLKPRDIADALRLPLPDVLQAIRAGAP